MKSYRDILKEGKKLFVFASWENGVLKWRTDDDRTGSDPMKKKPTEADLMKLFKKRFKKEIDLDFRKD